MNCPFPAGSGMKEIGGAFRDNLLPAIDEVQARSHHDLRRLRLPHRRSARPFTLTDEDFAELTALMKQAATDHCEGRLVSVLEGGYNLSGLASAVTAHVETLLED